MSNLYSLSSCITLALLTIGLSRVTIWINFHLRQNWPTCRALVISWKKLRIHMSLKLRLHQMRQDVQRLDLNLGKKILYLTNFLLSNHSLSFDWVENTEETQKNNTRKIQKFLKLLIYWSDLSQKLQLNLRIFPLATS